jgi:hypothetical protein
MEEEMQQESEAHARVDRVKQDDSVLPESNLNPTIYQIAKRFKLSSKGAYALVEAAEKALAKEGNSADSP